MVMKTRIKLSFGINLACAPMRSNMLQYAPMCSNVLQCAPTQGAAHLYQKHNAASHHYEFYIMQYQSTHFVHTDSLCTRVLYSHHFGCCIMSTMAAILGSQWFHTPLRLGSRATIGSMLTDHVALQSTLTAQCITTFSTASYDQQCSNLPSHVTIDQAALQSK